MKLTVVTAVDLKPLFDELAQFELPVAQAIPVEDTRAELVGVLALKDPIRFKLLKKYGFLVGDRYFLPPQVSKDDRAEIEDFDEKYKLWEDEGEKEWNLLMNTVVEIKYEPIEMDWVEYAKQNKDAKIKPVLIGVIKRMNEQYEADKAEAEKAEGEKVKADEDKGGT